MGFADYKIKRMSKGFVNVVYSKVEFRRKVLVLFVKALLP